MKRFYKLVLYLTLLTVSVISAHAEPWQPSPEYIQTPIWPEGKMPDADSSKDSLELNPNIRFTKDTPPTFLLQAENDPVDTINYSLIYYIGLKNAGVPAEIHLYAEGKHAFGLRKTQLPITNWPQLVITWLHTIRMIR